MTMITMMAYEGNDGIEDIDVLNILKLELAKYYKDSEMTAFISERSRNSK